MTAIDEIQKNKKKTPYPPTTTKFRRRRYWSMWVFAQIPYLEVHTEDSRRSRAKRNVLGKDCDENSKEQLCCRYPLTVDFEDFGWDWIIAPKKYEANYCSGECPMVFLQKYPHTHLAQLTNKSGAYPGTGPCCAPRKLSAISMLYFDQDLNIIYGLLPGMVVDRCGCS